MPRSKADAPNDAPQGYGLNSHAKPQFRRGVARGQRHRRGVEFCTTSPHRHPTGTPPASHRLRPLLTRPLVREVPEAITQYERALIRSRMGAGKAAKLAVGGYAGGHPPFGWRAEGKELVPHEREQEVIALARHLAQEGLSCRQIAARLEEAGHRPKVGERWSSVQVGRVLQKRGLAGSGTCW